MRRFVILVSLTADQETKLIEYLSKVGLGYWHWVQGSWLIEGHDNDLDMCTELRDEVQKIAPTEPSLVFEVTGVKPNFAGFGVQTEKRNMFTWIRDTWLDRS